MTLKFWRLLGYFVLSAGKIRKRLKMFAIAPLFEKIGSNVTFDADGYYKFSNICLGDDVFIGAGAHIAGPEVIIGNKVMIGPDVRILGGNHQCDQLGEYMFDCKDGGAKDRIVIEDDVWIGSNVIVLRGVTVGEGAVVGAGAMVVKSVPPYAVVVGAPARVLKMRFSTEEIELHRSIIRTKEAAA